MTPRRIGRLQYGLSGQLNLARRSVADTAAPRGSGAAADGAVALVADDSVGSLAGQIVVGAPSKPSVVLTSAMTPSCQAELSEGDSFDLVAAEVDPGGVAAEGHVEGQLVQLPSHRQRLAGVGPQRAAVVAGHHRVGMTNSGLNMALSTLVPAPPMVAVAPG
jgi:hypothetical protein